MKLLVDVSAGIAIAEALRTLGHDVLGDAPSPGGGEHGIMVRMN